MTKALWISLPVKDLTRSKEFFLSLGFETMRDVPEMVGFKIGDVPVMMVTLSEFEKYTQHKITDTKESSEVLLSFDAENKEEVDLMAEKVANAGGEIFSGLSDIQGWMYGFSFADLDGHRWETVYLDWDNMPKE